MRWTNASRNCCAAAARSPAASSSRRWSGELFPRPTHSRRPLLAGVAAAVGLAFALLGLSLAGVGPLGGTDHGVQAGSNCRYVTVIRHEPAPVIVQQASGQTTLQLQERAVKRRVKRCS